MYLTHSLTKIPVNRCLKLNITPKHISSLLGKSSQNGCCKSKVWLSTSCTLLQEDSALPLTKERARELIMRLNVEERGHLQTTLHEIESDKMKDEYKGNIYSDSIKLSSKVSLGARL